jgi:hypothetical protein
LHIWFAASAYGGLCVLEFGREGNYYNEIAGMVMIW